MVLRQYIHICEVFLHLLQGKLNVVRFRLYFDDKTKRLIENFYQMDEPNLKYNSLPLVEAQKSVFGKVYVTSFIESVKVNGAELFNIKNHEVELISREGSEFVEISLSAPRMGLVIKKRQIQQT